MRTLATLIVVAALSSGCGARRTRAGYPTPIPGCNSSAQAFVPKDCWLNPYPDYVEVACPDGKTTKFHRCTQ